MAINKSKLRIIEYIVVVCGVAAYIAYIVLSHESVLEFNASIHDLPFISDREYPYLAISLHQWKDKQKIDISEFRERIAAYKGRQTELTEALTQMNVPGGETAKALHLVAKEYIEKNIALAESYEQLVDYAEKHNPATEDEISIGTAITKPGHEATLSLLKRLRALQADFKKEHNVKN